MASLSFRHPKFSSLELYHKAKSLKEKSRIKLWKMSTSPHNFGYMSWLSRIAKASIEIFSRENGKVYKFKNPNSKKMMQLVCMRESKRSPSYSLIVSVKRKIYCCRRCRRVVFGPDDRTKHIALCAKRHDSEFHWRNKAMLSLTRYSKNPEKMRTNKVTRLRFLPGRACTWPISVQQRIENLGIRGFSHLFQRNYCYATYDCEASLQKFGSNKNQMLAYSSNFTFCNVHDLLNISLCWQISGDKSASVKVFWVSEKKSARQVVKEFVEFVNRLSILNFNRLRRTTFKQLLTKLDETEARNSSNGYLCNQIRGVKRALFDYLRRLVLCGYNSGSYDLVLLRRHGLFEFLQQDGDNFKITKKGRRYMLITTSYLRIIDILFFSPMKCPLSRFVETFRDHSKAWTSADGKAVFPHGLVRQVKDLQKPISAIRYGDFRDVLSGGQNKLAIPYKDYCRLRQNGLNETKALKRLDLSSRPLKGKDQFNFLKIEWERKNFKTVKDLLHSYSERDVRPFHESLKHFMRSFENLGLGSILHSYVSLPSASFVYFMNSCQSSSYFSNLSRDLYISMRASLVGGPSLPYRFDLANLLAKLVGTKNPENLIPGD